MEFQNLLVEIANRIAVVTINRPKALNALNSDTLSEIKKAFCDLEQNDEVDVIILTGSGEKAFVAGADISQMVNYSALEGREFGLLGQAVFNKVESCVKPVIAAVNGFCLGGGNELAMACDFRIASENAVFGQPEVKLGVTAGFGGTQRLPRLVGKGMAKWILLSGENIKADEALRIGLVNAVVPQSELLDTVKKMAAKIADKGQLAVRLSKAAINEGLEMDLLKGQDHEAQIFGLCFATEDQKEGMKAFLEKRKAEFKNK